MDTFLHLVSDVESARSLVKREILFAIIKNLFAGLVIALFFKYASLLKITFNTQISPEVIISLGAALLEIKIVAQIAEAIGKIKKLSRLKQEIIQKYSQPNPLHLECIEDACYMMQRVLGGTH